MQEIIHPLTTVTTIRLQLNSQVGGCILFITCVYYLLLPDLLSNIVTTNVKTTKSKIFSGHQEILNKRGAHTVTGKNLIILYLLPWLGELCFFL